MHVLVVGTDAAGAGSLAHDLRRNGYHVDKAETGRAALHRMARADLMLLDLELPGTDGLEVCRAVRDGSDIPLISVTEHTGEVDQVLALQAGCDDCLVKPIGLRELEARMAAVMRRARAQATQAPAASKVAHGPLALDSCAREARLHGRPVELTRKEFDLLFLLASQPATVVSRKDAMAKVWGYVWPTRSRTIDMHVSSLRKKLGATSWIVTVHGVGFRLGSP